LAISRGRQVTKTGYAPTLRERLRDRAKGGES
jgi:hypothetical protein